MKLLVMFKLRNVTIEDIKDIILINEDAIPAVNSVSHEEFLNFYEKKTYFKVAINNDNNICGFLLVLPSGLDYQSLNYKWFTERYSDFAYIDRIAISSKYRGLGIGKSLYLDLERSLDEYNMIACEFNIEPPNPISKKFHESLNYKNVGFQFTENNTKKVSLMVKNI